MKEISVKVLIDNVGYSKDYFDKILRKCRIDNRFLLTESDIVKLKSYPVCTQKAYKLRICLMNLFPDI